MCVGTPSSASPSPHRIHDGLAPHQTGPRASSHAAATVVRWRSLSSCTRDTNAGRNCTEKGQHIPVLSTPLCPDCCERVAVACTTALTTESAPLYVSGPRASYPCL